MQDDIRNAVRESTKESIAVLNELDDDGDYIYSLDEILDIILSNVENYPKNNMYQILSDYCDMQGWNTSDVLDINSLDSEKLRNGTNRKILASFSSDHILMGINTNFQYSSGIEFYATFKMGGASGKSIRLPFLQNFSSEKLSINGSDYYISEEDYNWNTISTEKTCSVNKQIIAQNPWAKALYNQAQQELIDSQNHYLNLYKGLSITFGTLGGITLIGGMVTGIVGKSMSEACIK